MLVSDPEKLDAVVQSSNRVFLIAKKVGQTNAFFFDTQGQQILTLEVSVGADLSALDDLIRRFVPGSSVKSEMAGNAIVLTGVVRTPLDAARAGDLAFQFAQANRSAISSPSMQLNATSKARTVDRRNATQPRSAKASQASRASKKSDLVINLLAIEGEEQVMLKVTVAEVQRSILKQFGINLGALIQSGNFSTAILTRTRFRSRRRPASASCRSQASERGSEADGPSVRNSACSATTTPARAAIRQLRCRHDLQDWQQRRLPARCAPWSATAWSARWPSRT